MLPPLLPPLSAGRHTIHFKGIIASGRFAGTYEAIYNLIVQGKT
jgi:hypothetical protein